MQNRSYSNQSISHTSPSNSLAPQPAPTAAPRIAARPPVRPAAKPAVKKDELTRIFNTALVSTQAGVKRDFSAELSALTESAPFKAILNAVRQLACVQGIPERQAAEEVIKAFRKMDEVWSDYIFREGLDRLRSPRS